MQYHIFISITHILCNTFSTNTAEIICAGFKTGWLYYTKQVFPQSFPLLDASWNAAQENSFITC